MVRGYAHWAKRKDRSGTPANPSMFRHIDTKPVPNETVPVAKSLAQYAPVFLAGISNGEGWPLPRLVELNKKDQQRNQDLEALQSSQVYNDSVEDSDDSFEAKQGCDILGTFSEEKFSQYKRYVSTVCRTQSTTPHEDASEVLGPKEYCKVVDSILPKGTAYFCQHPYTAQRRILKKERVPSLTPVILRLTATPKTHNWTLRLRIEYNTKQVETLVPFFARTNNEATTIAYIVLNANLVHIRTSIRALCRNGRGPKGKILAMVLCARLFNASIRLSPYLFAPSSHFYIPYLSRRLDKLFPGFASLLRASVRTGSMVSVAQRPSHDSAVPNEVPIEFVSQYKDLMAFLKEEQSLDAALVRDLYHPGADVPLDDLVRLDTALIEMRSKKSKGRSSAKS